MGTRNELINNELCLLLRLRNRGKKFIKLRSFLLFFPAVGCRLHFTFGVLLVQCCCFQRWV